MVVGLNKSARTRAQRLSRLASEELFADSTYLKYHLVVIAPTVAEVIEYTGGLVFDRGMAGWGVTVLLQDDEDARALQILGAKTLDFETAIEYRGLGFRPQAVVTSGSLYASDDRVRLGVQSIVGNGWTEATLWGDVAYSELGNDFTTVTHRLSAAAKAFKSQALAAASMPRDSVSAIEEFHGGRAMACGQGRSDLVPA